MATSSIIKEFYVQDMDAFERLRKELENAHVRKQVVESPALKEGRKKLATFKFR